MPLIIGVTGSIATGKSSACRLMEEQGATHLDADRLVHRLYDPGKPAFDRIVAIFGQEIIGEDGYIDRKILGSKVFGKPEEMTKLTTAIGNIAEAVKESSGPTGTIHVGRWRCRGAGGGKPDRGRLRAMVPCVVWLFACAEDTARSRLIQRNGFSEGRSQSAAWRVSAPGRTANPHRTACSRTTDQIEQFLNEVGAAYKETVRLSIRRTASGVQVLRLVGTPDGRFQLIPFIRSYLLNAGITSSANCSSCSIMTDCGVPTGMPTLISSSPGYCF